MKYSIHLQNPINRIFMAITLVFMYYQNQLINTTLDYFLCKQIGDKYYSMADYNQQCYQTTNMALPYLNIILYFVMILLCLFCMVKYREQNSNIYHNQSKMQSFLIYFHIGYNKKGYYFEFIRLLKRVLLVFFLKLELNDSLQNLQIFLLVEIIYLHQVNTIRPYKHIFCQKMEKLAIYGEILTFILMVSYNSDDDYQTSQSKINVTSIILNTLMNGLIFLYLVFKITQSFTEKYKYKYLAKLMKRKNETHRKVIRMWRKLSFHSWRLVRTNDLALSYEFNRR